MTFEAEQVLAYFRQEYWPHEERSANAVQLRRRLGGSSSGVRELIDDGILTQSLDQAYLRLTDKGVAAMKVQ